MTVRLSTLVPRWLKSAGSVLYRALYGADRYEESWTFPPRSLRTAVEALGLDDQHAFDLTQLPIGPGFSHILAWSDLVNSKKPIRSTHEKLAVLISTGMAIHARAVGSDRGIAELILFGPAPLSHYPPITPLHHSAIDDRDLRRVIDAREVLQKAQAQLKYHDATAALDRRLTNALVDLDRWFDS